MIVQFLSGGNFPERLNFICCSLDEHLDQNRILVEPQLRRSMICFSSDFRLAFRPDPGRDPGEFKCQVMALKEPKGLEEHFSERYLICKCFMLKIVT